MNAKERRNQAAESLEQSSYPEGTLTQLSDLRSSLEQGGMIMGTGFLGEFLKFSGWKWRRETFAQQIYFTTGFAPSWKCKVK